MRNGGGSPQSAPSLLEPPPSPAGAMDKADKVRGADRLWGDRKQWRREGDSLFRCHGEGVRGESGREGGEGGRCCGAAVAGRLFQCRVCQARPGLSCQPAAERNGRARPAAWEASGVVGQDGGDLS